MAEHKKDKILQFLNSLEKDYIITQSDSSKFGFTYFKDFINSIRRITVKSDKFYLDSSSDKYIIKIGLGEDKKSVIGENRSLWYEKRKLLENFVNNLSLKSGSKYCVSIDDFKSINYSNFNNFTSSLKRLFKKDEFKDYSLSYDKTSRKYIIFRN